MQEPKPRGLGSLMGPRWSYYHDSRVGAGKPSAMVHNMTSGIRGIRPSMVHNIGRLK